MTTALVLAGSSFVGRHLCRRLREAGVRVVATGRGPGGPTGTLACDLTDRAAVEEVVSGTRPQWVFQCAGATRTDDPHRLYGLHVGGTLNVLAAVARHAPAATVVLLGSAAEYGPVGAADLPVGEDHPPAPLSFFGASKLAQTQAARVAAAQWRLGVLVVRPFNVIGPGLPAHYFAGALAERLRRARADGAFGAVPISNAHATRDFVDVRDVADALLGLATRAAPPAGTVALYNIASGREVPLLAVARRLCELAGDFTPVDAGAAPSRSAIDRACGCPSRLQQTTGWLPRTSWEKSLEDLWSSGEPGGQEAGLEAPAHDRAG